MQNNTDELNPSSPVDYAKIIADPKLKTHYKEQLTQLFQSRSSRTIDALKALGWRTSIVQMLAKGKDRIYRSDIPLNVAFDRENTIGTVWRINGGTDGVLVDNLIKTPEQIANEINKSLGMRESLFNQMVSEAESRFSENKKVTIEKPKLFKNDINISRVINDRNSIHYLLSLRPDEENGGFRVSINGHAIIKGERRAIDIGKEQPTSEEAIDIVEHRITEFDKFLRATEIVSKIEAPSRQAIVESLVKDFGWKKQTDSNDLLLQATKDIGSVKHDDPTSSSIRRLTARIESNSILATLGDETLASIPYITACSAKQLAQLLDNAVIALDPEYSEHYQWRRNNQDGQTLGDQQSIVPLTKDIFHEHIAPMARIKDYNEYRSRFPSATHATLIKRPDAPVKVGAVGIPCELRPVNKPEEWAIRVDSFDSTNAIRSGNKADQEDEDSLSM